MWEKLLNLEKATSCPATEGKLTNNRHRYNIVVQDKVLKVKKNPAWIE